MPKLQIKFFQVDPTAKADITDITATLPAPWSVLDDLRVDRITPPENHMTLEPNFTVLNGEAAEFPDDTSGRTWGFWSAEMSDENGKFNPLAYPSVEVTFAAFHKSRGLTLYFYNDCGATARVTWYGGDTGANIIKEGVYTLDANIGVVRESVTDFKRIKIEFLSTAIRNRYIKLYAVDYGVARVLSNDEISICRIREDIDPTVESLSVNTLDAVIRTRKPVMSPITSEEFDDMMMERQVLTVTSDGEPYGTFFLESWQDVYQTGIEVDFSAGDAMGILDLYKFMGDIYRDKLVTELLDEIFAISFPTGLIKYVLDPEFSDSRISGWIPTGTCGMAFQHIMFALNATADTARIGDVWIYPREVDIKADSLPSSSDKQPFINMNDLRAYEAPFYYATQEPNYAVLDDALAELPDNTGDYNLGWCSMSMSDENGSFTTSPVLELSFSTSHNADGITFDFGAYENEYVKRMRVTFEDENANVLLSKEYEFTKSPGVITDSVLGYRYIKIEVLQMSAPFRYAKIMAIDYGISFRIPRSNQARTGSDKPTAYWSGVDVISHDYVEGAETVEVHNGELPQGPHVIEFLEPLHSLSVTGAVITKSNANYAEVNVLSGGNVVVLTGGKYVDNQRIHSVRSQVAAGAVETVKRYENYTLVSPDRGFGCSEYRFNFLKNRIRTENTVMRLPLDVGYIASVETYGRKVVGTILSLDTNLRANKSNMVVVGNAVD